MGEPARKYEYEDNIISLLEEVQECCEENEQPVDRYALGREVQAKKKKVLPFRSTKEINQVVSCLLEDGKYRDGCLVVMGCNFGLRIDDLLHIRWRDLLNADGEVRATVEIVEQKNKNHKQIFVNRAVIEAVMLYRQHINHQVNMDDYIFVSEGRRKSLYVRVRGKKQEELHMELRTTPDGNILPVTQPITEQLVSSIIRKVTNRLGLTIGGRRYSTHSMRKTCFRAVIGGYGKSIVFPECVEINPVRLLLAQHLAGHSKAELTLQYADFEDLFCEETYLALNLGLEAVQEYAKTHNETVVYK